MRTVARGAASLDGTSHAACRKSRAARRAMCMAPYRALPHVPRSGTPRARFPVWSREDVAKQYWRTDKLYEDADGLPKLPPVSNSRCGSPQHAPMPRARLVARRNAARRVGSKGCDCLVEIPAQRTPQSCARCAEWVRPSELEWKPLPPAVKPLYENPLHKVGRTRTCHST